MSLTDAYETKILTKLLRNEASGSEWTTNRANLKLKVCSVSPGEDGTGTAVVSGKEYGASTDALGSFVIENSLAARTSKARVFSFSGSNVGNVVCVALYDGEDAVWYEEITGTARREYLSGDSLTMSQIAFAFSGGAACSGLTNAVLDQLFLAPTGNSAYQSTYWPSADLYLALYDGDPGFDGTTANEVTPTNSRVQINSNDWTIEGNVAYNSGFNSVDDDPIIVTGFTSDTTITHIALRGNSSPSGGGADPIYWRGSLLSTQVVRPNDRFVIEPGQLTIALD